MRRAASRFPRVGGISEVALAAAAVDVNGLGEGGVEFSAERDKTARLFSSKACSCCAHVCLDCVALPFRLLSNRYWRCLQAASPNVGGGMNTVHAWRCGGIRLLVAGGGRRGGVGGGAGGGGGGACWWWLVCRGRAAARGGWVAWAGRRRLLRMM